MDRSLGTDLANVQDLRQIAQGVLERAADIIAKSGENLQSLGAIGELLREMSASGVLDELSAQRSPELPARIKVLGQHADGPMLSFYGMDDWRSPPSADVHWHNYWQVIYVMRGTWRDTVWKPVTRVAHDRATGVAVDRRENLPQGDLQILGPDEPHGWDAGERRRAEGVHLLMWSGSAGGRPRVDLDITTGQLSESYDALNPRPDGKTDG